MNGDQLQYEIDNAGVPLEQRSDYPLSSFDAADWAKAFARQFPAISEDDVLPWFACALMRGYDEYSYRQHRYAEQIEEIAERLNERDAELSAHIGAGASNKAWWRRLFTRGARS